MAKKENNTPWILGFIAFSMIFNKVAGDTKEEKEGGKALDQLEKLGLNHNPFNVNGFKLPEKAGMYRYTLTTQTATQAASTMNAGIGYVSDDEAMIVKGIKMAATRADVHFIASMYARVYKRDLFVDLKQNLAKKSELGGLIATYVLSLPSYVKKGVKR